jgi:hypothetical protein
VKHIAPVSPAAGVADGNTGDAQRIAPVADQHSLPTDAKPEGV